MSQFFQQQLAANNNHRAIDISVLTKNQQQLFTVTPKELANFAGTGQSFESWVTIRSDPENPDDEWFAKKNAAMEHGAFQHMIACLNHGNKKTTDMDKSLPRQAYIDQLKVDVQKFQTSGRGSSLSPNTKLTKEERAKKAQYKHRVTRDFLYSTTDKATTVHGFKFWQEAGKLYSSPSKRDVTALQKFFGGKIKDVREVKLAPLTPAEDMYINLVRAHIGRDGNGDLVHYGRDKMYSNISRTSSWIIKETCAIFAQLCPGCGIQSRKEQPTVVVPCPPAAPLPVQPILPQDQQPAGWEDEQRDLDELLGLNLAEFGDSIFPFDNSMEWDPDVDTVNHADLDAYFDGL